MAAEALKVWGGFMIMGAAVMIMEHRLNQAHGGRAAEGVGGMGQGLGGRT
jgi:hypothetical protein